MVRLTLRERLTSVLAHVKSGRRAGALSLVGLLAVPLVIAGLLVWGLWDPQARLTTVNAAIVNHDQPVELNGQLVPLGRQLTAGLVGTQDGNFNWIITDAPDAKAGLNDGRYTVVVTIPEDFSARATSGSGSAPRQADVSVATSDSGRLMDAAISQAVTAAAVGAFNREITVNAVTQLLSGFTQLHDRLGDAASGAKELASGSQSYANGVQTFANGMDNLSTSAAAIPGQVGQLADGSSQITSALQQVQSGLDQLEALGRYMWQVCEADPMSSECAALQQQLIEMLTAAAGQVQPDSLKQLIGGSEAITSGLYQLRDGLGSLSDGIAQSASGASQLAAGATGIASGTSQFASGLDQAVAAIPHPTAAEATASATVLAEPIAAQHTGNTFGAAAAPIAAGLALWIGAIAIYLVLRPFPRDALGSVRTPIRQAAYQAAPALFAAVGQGLVVAAVMQISLGLSLAGWLLMAVTCVAAALVFTLVNQALVAVFSGAGRFLALIVATLFLATAIVSTVPGLLATASALLPVTPAVQVIAWAAGGANAASALGALVVWGLLAFVATVLTISRIRIASPAALLRRRSAITV